MVLSPVEEDAVVSLLQSSPLAASALSHSDVMFAMSKLLQRADAALISWCGTDPLRLAAILTTLYVEEALEHRQSKIFDVHVRDLHRLLLDLVATYSITRDQLIDSVALVDSAGDATRLLCSSDWPLPPPTPDGADSISFATWYGRMASPLQIVWVAVCGIALTCVIADDLVQTTFLICSAGSCLVVAVTVWRNTRSKSPVIPPPASTVAARSGNHRLSAILNICCVYMLLTILYSISMPATAVAALAHSRVERYPFLVSCVYFALGSLSALQPAINGDRTDWLRMGRLVTLLLARLLQLCCAVDDPLHLFGASTKVAVVPFCLGAFLTLVPEGLMRSLWAELHQAKLQVNAANAEAAAERNHAWALETARREQLKSGRARTRKARAAQRPEPPEGQKRVEPAVLEHTFPCLDEVDHATQEMAMQDDGPGLSSLLGAL